MVRRSSSKSKHPKVSTPVPATTHHHHTVEVERPGFFSNMWQGFGWGTGQTIARNIFGNDPVVHHVHTHDPKPDIQLPKEFVQCMKDNQNDKDLCKQFLQ